MNKTIEMTLQALEAKKARSAWDKGVKNYAIDLVNDLDEAIEGGYFNPADLTDGVKTENALLSGAKDWKQFSWGGSALIYDYDIAKALCNPSELKKTDNGFKRPNAREEWLDVQARALYQAAALIRRTIREVTA